MLKLRMILNSSKALKKCFIKSNKKNSELNKLFVKSKKLKELLKRQERLKKKL